MPTINLSFADQTYSSSNKPSIETLKSDLSAIEAAVNALTDVNIATGADINPAKLDTSKALTLNNNIALQFRNTSAALDAYIKETVDNDLGYNVATGERHSFMVNGVEIFSLTSVSAKTDYSPTWTADSGTNPAVGNGTLTGWYFKIGTWVYFRVHLASGSSTTWGTSVNWRIGLPVVAADETQTGAEAYYLDAGSGEAMGYGFKIPAGGVQYCQIGGAAGGFWDNVTPISWSSAGAGDQWIVQGWYRAAS